MQNTGGHFAWRKFSLQLVFIFTNHYIYSSTTFVIISITSITQTYVQGFKIEENLIDTSWMYVQEISKW